MSDYSTNAWNQRAKDPCPYCGELTPFAGQLIDQQRKENKWVLDAESRYDTLEKRYKQLEQVAKGMLKTIGDFRYNPILSVAESYYREELEKCGVSIDG